MPYTSFRRNGRTSRLLTRLTALVLTLILALDFLRVSFLSAPSSISLTPPTNRAGLPPPPTPRVFIASIHWNNEAILRSNWNAAVADLVRALGPSNVYVSVLESGSWDDSKGALRELDGVLEGIGVRRTVMLDETTHADVLETPPDRRGDGWIETSRDKGRELRRIPYLAGLRNVSLQPLWDLEKEGVVFDKVLFLNDVVFTPQDVQTLIDTRDGDYAAACSLDFSKPPSYYDTFALRDSEGRKTATSAFPYFISPESRDAMVAGHAVPVQSCWNGMVVFDSSPFYNGTLNAPALAFRGIPDTLATTHLEGSECCLIHYDNPLTKRKGVFVNPHVRVAYTPAAYAVISAAATPKRWPGTLARVRGLWANRLARGAKKVAFAIETSDVRRRVKAWQQRGASEDEAGSSSQQARPRRDEPGANCLINEMQVLIPNGWAHV